MKHLLACFYVLVALKGMSQETTEPQKLTTPFGKPFTLSKMDRDSVLLFKTPRPATTGKMPNAFNINLPAPKFTGANGKGQEIYILPLDNMPMLKPDSNYHFNMPCARFYNIPKS